MARHPLLRHLALAVGFCLLLVSIGGLFLVSTARPPSPLYSDTPRAQERGLLAAPARSSNASALQPNPSAAARAVRETWQRARDAGAYSFSTDLTQLAYPERSLANSGRGPQTVALHLEGEVDLPAHTLGFRMWQPDASGSGSPADGGVDGRVEGDRVYVRGADGSWQEVENFSASFAPDNDPLAFLGGMVDVRELEPLEQSPIFDVSRFAFDLDGPKLADHLRDRLARYLTEKGELPPGVSIDVPSSLRQMDGTGELWVDARGMPLRLTMHLVFPQAKDGSQIQADVQTRFSGFPQDEPERVAALGSLVGLPAAPWPARAGDIAAPSAVVAGSLLVIVLLMASRRVRWLHATVMIVLIVSMVITPSLQSERVAAYYDRQAARPQDIMQLSADGRVLDASAAQDEQEGYQTVGEYLAPHWDPLHDPLTDAAEAKQAAARSGDDNGGLALRPVLGESLEEAPIAIAAVAPSPSPTPPALDCDDTDTEDTDGDGVNDYEECVYFTDFEEDDTDEDGLSDGQELNKLATIPTEVDSDSDLITDTVEVEGFILGGRTWYLNPNNPDSNNDGMVDSAECPALVEVANPSATIISQQCDADKDNIPDPFEFDNDNDGVPDAVDLSPNQSVTYNGLGYGRATTATAFNNDRPFKLAVTNLVAGWPVLVDLQLRPLITDHLSYAYNVLDWPANDVDGQIQHKKATTFFDLSPQDAAGAQGDIRLIPLLQINMTGQLPLKLTTPRAKVIVGQGTAVSTTVTLEPATATSTRFTYALPAGTALQVYKGTCAELDAQPLIALSGTSGTLNTHSVVQIADGNHALVMVGTIPRVCAEIHDVPNGIYADKMVDEAPLAPYGITLSDQGDGSVTASVPLNVATDDTGGGKSAFTARMIYWPGTTNRWEEPQTMKVLWLVQMLTDACAPGAKSWEEYSAEHEDASQEDYDRYFDDYCWRNRTADEATPIQVYDEDWYLSGMVVREDHGLDLAVAYVNPKLSTYDDDPLYTLSMGLGEQLLTGMDCRTSSTILSPISQPCSGDLVRDLGVSIADHTGSQVANSTIEQRFDITATVPITTRWGIPQNALQVESFRYDHQDYLAYHSMTQTPRILAQYTVPLTTTILQAREERYRSGRLEAGTMTQGGALTVDLNTTDYPETTLAGLLWTPYRPKDKTTWEAVPPTEYWDYLEMELGRRLREMYPSDPEDVNYGRMIVARSYSMSLINGMVNTVVHCVPGQLLCPMVTKVPYTDDMIIKATKDMMNGLDAIIIKVVFKIWEEWKSLKTADIAFDVQRNGDLTAIDNALEEMDGGLPRAGNPEKKLYQVIGGQVKSYILGPYQTLLDRGARGRITIGVVWGAAAVAVLATIIIASVLKVERAQIAAIVIRTINLLMATQGMLAAISGYINAAEKAIGTFIKMLKRLQPSKNVAGIVTTALAWAMTWAAFGILVSSNHLARGGAAFMGELAFAIASSLVTLILFIIFTALGAIGAIVQAIFGMINAIASLICSALPEKAQKSKAGYWLCAGITGFITNALKWLFYSGTIMVQMAPEDYERLEMYGFSTALEAPENGVVLGNAIKYSISLTNTIALAQRPISPYTAKGTDGYYQYSTETLARATFDYQWQEDNVDLHGALTLDGMTSSWLQRNNDRRLYYTETVSTIDPFPLEHTGINRTIDGLYLSEAYAVPEQVCFFSDCDIKTKRGTNHYDLGSDLKYDVLPATLSGFHQLTSTVHGWVLAWGQSGALKFPPLDDADGDGLVWLEDPDDSKWDADGDTLSDAFEIETYTNPLAMDSDNDGLSDLEEARYRTDPNRADSDGDGLYDCQEIFHQVTVVGDSTARAECGEPGTWSGGWSVVYGKANGAPLTTHVTPNPMDADTEGDGLTDGQEKTYGYSPQSINALNVLSLESTLSEVGDGGVLIASDRFVFPGQTLYYTAVVKNELDNRQAQGLLFTEAEILDDSAVLPQSFVLRPQAQASLTGNLTVPASATSGTGTVTQVAGASIVDLQVASNQASLWLRFDDPSTSTVYLDSSGADPPHDATCVGTGCVLDPAAGQVGGALKLSGMGYARSGATVPNAAYSVSFWFKVDAAHSVAGVLFATEQNDRVKIYLDAGHVAVLSGSTTMASTRTFGDDQWHHVAHTDPGYGGVGQQVLYVDGIPAAAPGAMSNLSTAPTAGLLVGGKSTTRVIGTMDDVRLFERVLTAAEVELLANQPLFHMDFDQTDRWVDVSSYHTAVEGCIPVGSMCLPYGPAHDTNAVTGSAANLSGTQYLNVPAASQLDLSGGRFTLSAWIFPHNRPSYPDWQDPRDTFPQAILGLQSGTGSAYPTLQRVGRKIRFSLGTGSAWHTPYESGNVLMENQWNHVALTLDKAENGGTLRLYVNARLVDTKPFAVTNIAPASSFEIGRSSNTGRLDLTRYEQADFKDEGGLECYSGARPEMCMAMDQAEVFSWKPPSCGTGCWNYAGIDCPAAQGVDFSGSVSLQLWEDDDDPLCGPVHSHAPTNAGNDDDECEMTGDGASGVTTLNLTTNDAGFDARTYTFSGCNSSGSFRLKYTHDSIPFYGRMDEVQIFGQPLDADAIARLYLDPATLLHLPLDEAPGATAFEDMSLDRVPASCTGSDCPASGVGGRTNQAAEFSSAKGTAIRLGRSAANALTGPFTVAAWAKPTSPTSTQRIVSTARTLSNNGWGLGLANGGLSFSHYGYATSATSGLALQANQWTHVAAVVSAEYTVTFYVDGQIWPNAVHSGTYGAAADPDDIMLVGAATAAGQSSLSELFDGQIDDLWVFNIAVSAEQMLQLYEAAPVMHLRLEEAHGATQFADNAAYNRPGACTAPGCPLCGEGVSGQVGLAAQFDGQNDVLKTGDKAALRPTTFSVGAWVMPMGKSEDPQDGLLHEVVGKWTTGTTNYRLYMSDSLTPGLGWGCAGTDIKLNADQPLIENHWNHVMGTFDGRVLRLYVNGIESASHSLPAAGSCTSTANVEIGGKSGLSSSQFFNGALDEVVLYGRALTPKQVRDLYLYQAGWVEDRQPHDITVDSDLPTVEVLTENGSYLANRRVSIGVIAGDATSAVEKVELGAMKVGGTLTWTEAERCADALGFPPGAWCPSFTPKDQGVYQMKARATDLVGHIGISPAVTVYVDDSAPLVTLGQVTQQLNGEESKGKCNTWTVHLSGTAEDPALATGVSGSGVPEDGVRVTVREADGKEVGSGRQMATLSGTAWSLDYTIPAAKADGCLTVEVEVVDRVADLVKTDSTQLARHTTVVSGPIVLDASAPKVVLDKSALAGDKLRSEVIALSGAISARPAAVRVTLTGGAGADTARAVLTCQHGNEGSFYTLFDVQPGMLTTGGTIEWEGEIHQGSYCEVEMTTTLAANISGVIEACGAPVRDWSGSFAGTKIVGLTLIAPACVPTGCSADWPVSGLAGVDVAFPSTLPGSAFVNEAPAGEVLYLPFEDTPDENGILVLRDISGGGNNGTCGSGGCPATGEPGPSGSAAVFDGANDAVEVASFGTFTTTTVSAWVLRTGSTTNRETIVSYKESASAGFVLALEGQVPKFLVRVGSAWQSVTDGSNQVALDHWVHLAGTYDGSTLRLYRDGIQVGQLTVAGNMTQAAANMAVGSQNSLNQHWFPGAIDDVRVFSRALAAEEIEGIYTGSGPRLNLSFEKEWVAGGDAVEDSSGWRHHGTVETGSGDTANKATTGQVGSHALSLDGVDDHVQIPDHDALDFAYNQEFAVALWIKVDTQADLRNTDNDIVEKWSGAGGYPYVIRYLRTNGTVHGARWDGSHNPTIDSSVAINDGKFHHVAFVKQGATLYLYIDGKLDGSRADTTSGDTTNSSPLYIGSRSSVNYFKGTVDDLRVYGRALLAQEVADLYHAGWQPAILAQKGNAVVSSRWTITVPVGLEGAYNVDMRGIDVAGHVAATAERSVLWTGEVDNLGPRVTLCRALVSDSTYRYVTVAQDFNLAEKDWASPCPISARTYFQSPWYITSVPAGTERLSQLTAACELSTSPTEQATACDTFGNCSTVGLTEGGICEEILAAAAAATEAESARLAKIAAAASGGSPEPAIVIAPTVITSTHTSEGRAMEVTGWVTGSDDVSGVQVAIGSSAGSAVLSAPANTWPFTRTWSYAYLWSGDTLPDGITQTAVAAATLESGPVVTTAETLTLDVVPPTAVALTLSSDGVPVEPRTTVRGAAPGLALSWTPAVDGSGLGSYQTTWRVVDVVTTTTTVMAHDPAEPLQARYDAHEVQYIEVGLTSRDTLGNERWQPWGAVLVDGALTPDLLRIPAWFRGGTSAEFYSGWMESGCALLGTDERSASRNAGSDKPAQRFYVTWDEQALRMAFTGAAWSGESDIFIYLDTGAGGTDVTFTPYPLPETATHVFLPSDLGADRLIWLKDEQTASILRWDGTQWTPETALSGEHCRVDWALNGGQVDLYLPFELLGLQAGDPLGLLAFATEDPQPDKPLHIWATFPTANPVNSARSNPRAFLVSLLEGKGARMPLLHYYHWAALGDAVCPNGTVGAPAEKQYNDTQLRATIIADPTGVTVSGVGGGLYWTGDPEGALADLSAGLIMEMLNAEHPPLLDGQPITYTIQVANEGSHTLQGAWLEFSAFGQLRLLDERADLGDLLPGSERTITARGVTDRSQSERALAVALARLYAAGHDPGEPALEWVVAANRVDRGAPSELELHSSAGLVGPGTALLSGRASDESGIRHIDAEIISPSGVTSTLTCDVDRTASGYWYCPWDVSQANGGNRPADGEAFTARLRATDGLGHVSNWTPPLTIRVDALPPSLKLASEVAGAWSGRIVSGSSLRLMGEVSDNDVVGSVTVCLEGQTCRTADLSVPGSPSSRWSQWVTTVEAMDYVTRTVTISATDRLGNRIVEGITFPVIFDNVAPVLTANQLLNEVALGSNLAVLSGQVRDGGPDVGVSVRIEAADGVVTRLPTSREGQAWSFKMPTSAPGAYRLWADAEDLAGNVSTAGPFTVEVVCTDATLMVTGLTAEPVAGWPISLTLSATIHNAGPDPLPAGVSASFMEDDSAIGVAMSTVALGPGDSRTFNVMWAPAEARTYDLTVAPLAPATGEGSPAVIPLCRMPTPTRLAMSVRDLRLYEGWNLVAAPVQIDDGEMQTVQRGIAGDYAAILGYEDGIAPYYPDRPQDSTLTAIEPGRGYWIRITSTEPLTGTLYEEPLATWRMAGEELAVDQDLPLAAGWNLTSYLPHASLPVGAALQSIAGAYSAALGFERTGLSYYPDLGLKSGYNTLLQMKGAAGYWIHATQAVTLHYPPNRGTPEWSTPTLTDTIAYQQRMDAIRLAEEAAGVRPTYTWMNLYGRLYMDDHSLAPIGTTVTAMANGVVCGATAVTNRGLFGLLACYGDDQSTPEVDGARTGDTITLLLNGEPVASLPIGFNGQGVEGGQPVLWTAHGDRWEVEAGEPYRFLLPMVMARTHRGLLPILLKGR